MLTEIVRTEDAVLVSYVQALFRDRGIDPVVLDRNLSQLHGAVGLQPLRVAVAAEDWAAARLLLIEAGLGAHVYAPGAGRRGDAPS